MGICISWREPEDRHNPESVERALELAQAVIKKAAAESVIEIFATYQTIHRLDDGAAVSKPVLISFSICPLPKTWFDGSESISFGGGGYQVETGLYYNFTKTQYIENFQAGHVLVAEIVDAWRKEGLVREVNDEGGYLPSRHLARLGVVPTPKKKGVNSFPAGGYREDKN